MIDTSVKSTHWSERATCGCHYDHKHMMFVNVALRELLILTIIEVNASD